MTLFVQLIQPADGAPYFSAWVDEAPGIAGNGKTRTQAIGALLLVLAQNRPDLVEVREQPAADFSDAWEKTRARLADRVAKMRAKKGGA